MEVHADIATQYADFAAEAVGSPCFEAWAQAVPSDPAVVTWLSTLPVPKRQPNLVFAAARWHGVPAPGPYAGLRAALLADDGAIRATIMARATQTNEVGRLATLVPAFASLGLGGRGLALIEVGASAGLNLYPDRWGYDWAGTRLGPEPRLPCAVTGPAPLPAGLPAVAWRGGIDLHPLSVTDADAMAWLETLVWPEEDDRRARLRHAVAIAQEDPPTLVAGDLLGELPALVEQASSYGPVVVFHSAVITYLVEADREHFHDLMSSLVADGACHWVSNEGPRVLSRIVPPVPAPAARFVLGVDGRAVAFTHGHGRSLDWFG